MSSRCKAEAIFYAPEAGMERSKRLALFVRQLDEVAPAATFEEARLLLESVLNAVENLHSGAPFSPDDWREDGRLYPPQDDSEIRSPIAGVRVFRTLKHRVWFAANGAIRITAVADGKVMLDKPGKDGGHVPA